MEVQVKERPVADVDGASAPLRVAFPQQSYPVGQDALICVAALGFGDVGPDLFEKILELMKPASLLAFNIKEQFLNSLDPTGFNDLFCRLQAQKKWKPLKQWRHFHRLSTWGEPIYYAGVVAEVL